MKTKITITPIQVNIITYAIAFFGLFSELGHIFIDKLSPRYFLLTQNLNFYLFGLETYNPAQGQYGIKINLLNLILYLLLLAGTVIYTISKGKETKLIRFVISIVLFSNTWFLMLNVFSENFVIMALFITKNVVIIGLAYWVLEGLNQTKELNITYTEELDKKPVFTPIKSLNEERLVHFILDLIICLSIFLDILIRYKITGVGYLVIIIFRIFYYTFFESIFGTTPAKFLTETRVIDDMNGKTTIGTFFRRSCYRHIPFDSFSFLLAKTGWHDSLSETIVVREKRTGVNGLRYLMIAPIVVVLLLTAKFAEKYYEQYRVSNRLEEIYNKEANVIKKQLEKLTTSDIIFIENRDNSVLTRLYIKIEKINGDEIVVRLIPYSDNNFISKQLEDAYNTAKISEANAEKNPKDTTSYKKMATYYIKRNDLNLALTDYEQYKNGVYKGIDILGNGKYFRIKQIERLFCPNIKLKTVNSSDTDIAFYGMSLGQAAQLIEIQNIDGNISWLEQLPKYIDSGRLREKWSGEWRGTPFDIRGKVSSKDEKYKFKMIFLDEREQTLTYLVQGKGREFTIELVTD